MTKEHVNETISLLTTTNNSMQAEYCLKVLNHYILHNLPHINSHPSLAKKLKIWNIRVNAHIVELDSGMHLPHTKDGLAEIGSIIEALQNTMAD